MTKDKFKCYCCGKKLGKTFFLVAHYADTERVFLMLPEHKDLADADYKVEVTRKELR